VIVLGFFCIIIKTPKTEPARGPVVIFPFLFPSFPRMLHERENANERETKKQKNEAAVL
jgi:hypothetical protein